MLILGDPEMTLSCFAASVSPRPPSRPGSRWLDGGDIADH